LVWGFLFLNSGLGGKISGVFFGYLGREWSALNKSRCHSEEKKFNPTFV
jgi:hypothetical protein